MLTEVTTPFSSDSIAPRFEECDMPASSQWNMTTRSFGPHPKRSAYDFSAARADCGSIIVSGITIKLKKKTIFMSEAHFAEPWHGNGNESCGKCGKKRFRSPVK